MNLRFLQRLLCSVFVVWFALFPTLSYASETVTNETYTYDWREAEREMLEYIDDEWSLYTVTDDDVANGLLGLEIIIASVSPWEVITSKNFGSSISPLDFSTSAYDNDYKTSMANLMSAPDRDDLAFYAYLTSVDGSEIISKGDTLELNLSGLYAQLYEKFNYGKPVTGGYSYAQSQQYFNLDPNSITGIVLEYQGQGVDTVYFDIPLEDIVINGMLFGVDSELPAPDFDVTKLGVIFEYDIEGYNYVPPVPSSPSGCVYNGTVEVKHYYGISDGILKVTVPDESVGLLKGIIEWLRSIVNGITDVKNNIVSLPSKIWNFIQEGLKMLFIPSEEDISNMHEQWQGLMRDRFGAIYESGDIVHSFSQTMSVNSAMVADTGGIITMPAVTANLAGTNFTFGGYEVDLVPDGFQWLVTSLKMLINIVCTILFINALKGKIEVLLR